MTALPHASPPPGVPGPSLTDFLAALRRSTVLTDRDFRRCCDRIEIGRYPAEPIPLAQMLIAKRVMTEYQARRVLSHGGTGVGLGRYVILDRLGKGSMGRVYRALHRPMGRVVALKVIGLGASLRPGALDRFQREMQLIGRLDHPNIVRAFDADQVGTAWYLAMEFLQGQSLERMLEAGGAFDPRDVVSYARQAALGLAHAHSRGVIHRDIKPSNLMVDGSGVLKILDFGVGLFVGSRPGEPAEDPSNDGTTVGTITYMSPEQAEGRAVDGRSDLYSLGCVMYHLLAGRPPFSAPDKIAAMALREERRPDPIEELRPDLDPSIAAVVGRLMEHRPEDRYQSGEEVAEALGGWSPRIVRVQGDDAPTGTPQVSTMSR